MQLFSFLAICGVAVVTGQAVDGDGVTAIPNPVVISGQPPAELTTVQCDVDNCISCHLENQCQSCADGFSANGTVVGVCEACTVDNCATCEQGISNCSFCMEGYYIADGACTSCSVDGCGECYIDDDGAEVCDVCMEGYYSASGGCTACGDNCDNCAEVDPNGIAGGCLECSDGYEVSPITGECAEIGTDCGDNCLVCEENAQCKTCEDGYSVQLFSDGIRSGCAPCPTNCKSCADADTCDECMTDYIYDDYSGSCATQDQIYANVCDCRTTVNNGCTCPGDETTSKDGCCDMGGMCDANDPDGVCATYNQDVCTEFENCAYCFGQSYCGSCDIGYYKSEGRAFGDCLPLPTGWDLDLCAVETLYNDECDCSCGGVDPECAAHTVSNCDDTGDQVYCDASGECAVCTLEGCAFCANGDAGSSECQECLDGYDLNETSATCVACEVEGCSSCQAGLPFNADNQTSTDEVVVCKVCMDGYYGSIDGSCTACTAENCEQCNEDTCNKCMDGYVLDDTEGTCSNCGDHCLQCGASSCNRCESGYEVVNGVCGKSNEDCGNNCDTCQRGGQCKVCDTGYWVGAGTNGKCASCIENCQTCRDGESCTTCDDSYSFQIDIGECVPQGNCLADVCDCRESENNGCTCIEDETSAKFQCCNADCGLCSDHCADYDDQPCTDFDNCAYCFGQDFCMECKDGFYQAVVDGDCLALPVGWDLDLCDVNTLKNNQCDCECGGYDPECDDEPAEGCPSGDYCDSTGACAECTTAGCMHCSNGDANSDGTCLECTDGHYMTDDGECMDCSLEGCAVCLVAEGVNTTFSCKQCADGYYSTFEDLCAVCDISDCATCEIDGTCGECEDGFALIDGACVACGDNCLDCTGDTSSCKRCADGYEVVTDGSCGQVDNDCGNNCFACGAQGICKTCMNTYYKNTDSECVACMDNCGSCSNADTCNECESGYGYTDAGGCEAYSDAAEYCANKIRDGEFSEGTECVCLGWECAAKVDTTEAPLALRR